MTVSRVTTYLVGRDPRCDRRLDDPSVSRRHAEVVPASDGRLYVTDRASSGGTFVRRSGEWARIRQAWVGPADRIRFGGYEMGAADLAALCGGGAGPAPPAPVPDPVPAPAAPAPAPPVPAPPPPAPAPPPPAPAPPPPAPVPAPPAPARDEKKRPVRDPLYGDIVESQDDR